MLSRLSCWIDDISLKVTSVNVYITHVIVNLYTLCFGVCTYVHIYGILIYTCSYNIHCTSIHYIKPSLGGVHDKYTDICI